VPDASPKNAFADCFSEKYPAQPQIYDEDNEESEIGQMRKNSIKNMRINNEVQRELSAIIRDVKDPRIHPLCSVVAVDVATDLKTCKVYVSVIGSEEERASTAEGLKSAAGYIRRELAHSLNLRNTPELRFIMDTSIEDAMDMMKKIDDVARQDHAGNEE